MKKIVVYGMESCPHCMDAKTYFEEQGVDFEFKDVKKDRDARHEFQKSGHAGVPWIKVGDKEFVGFDKAGIEAALNE